MTASSWDAGWFDGLAAVRHDLWRGVEAQHRVATMRLVDDLHEQMELERLLEASKPPLPQGTDALHYLVSTPFRYAPPWASRFRQPDQPGAWYGSDNPLTVAAELAWWRWRFFMDSDGLRGEELVTEHTFFRARFEGIELDITVAPWNSLRERWRHPSDYSACHQLAAEVRGRTEPPVAAIRYESARREASPCNVVFDPHALRVSPRHQQQTWVCKTTRHVVLMIHEGDALEFRQD